MANRLKSFILSVRTHGLWRTLKRVWARLSFLFFKLVLKRELGIRKIHGNKMYLDLKNHGISEALWLEGTREELDVEIVQREVKPGMNVLEVGSNIGYYLLIEARAMEGRGKIYAFEPDPRNVSLLKKNIALNNLEKIVSFYPYAVSDKEAVSKFHLAKFSNLSSIQNTADSTDSVEVKTVKIDNFAEINNEINFVRMDIEGYECEAIRGMEATLARSKNVKILVELHPRAYGQGRNFTEVVGMLGKSGFKVKYLVSAGEHSPKAIIDKGYKPVKVKREMAHSHGLYENISIQDLIAFIANPVKIVRSVLFVKAEHNDK